MFINLLYSFSQWNKVLGLFQCVDSLFLFIIVLDILSFLFSYIVGFSGNFMDFMNFMNQVESVWMVEQEIFKVENLLLFLVFLLLIDIFLLIMVQEFQLQYIDQNYQVQYINGVGLLLELEYNFGQ